MTPELKTIDLAIIRKIPASPEEAFDGWLDPTCPGTPWSVAAKYILDPKIDGLYYWLFVNEAGEGKHHYGRFTTLDRPSKIQCTWVSLHTRGLESIVTITFEKSGEDTLMKLRHENLPDDDGGRGHGPGWTFLVGQFADHLSNNPTLD